MDILGILLIGLGSLLLLVGLFAMIIFDSPIILLFGILIIVCGVIALLYKKYSNDIEVREEIEEYEIKEEYIPIDYVNNRKMIEPYIVDEFSDYGQTWVLKYRYTLNVVGSDLISKDKVGTAEIGSVVNFVFEPDNTYDNKAILVTDTEYKPFGYVPKGNIQSMIHDFTNRSEPIRAMLIDDNPLKIDIAFYVAYEKYTKNITYTVRL